MAVPSGRWLSTRLSSDQHSVGVQRAQAPVSDTNSRRKRLETKGVAATEEEAEAEEGEGGRPVFGGMKMGSPKHTSSARNTSLRCVSKLLQPTDG